CPAEDGIRDATVTGVQTCALPICIMSGARPGPQLSVESCQPGRAPLMILGSYHMSNPGLDATNLNADDVLSSQRQAEIARTIERSDERRVGKEWRGARMRKAASRG